MLWTVRTQPGDRSQVRCSAGRSQFYEVFGSEEYIYWAFKYTIDVMEELGVEWRGKLCAGRRETRASRLAAAGETVLASGLPCRVQVTSASRLDRC